MTLYALFTGLIAAMIHVISGPDHLAAVTPFAIESKKKAWKVGLFWGIGHILGMLTIGLLFLLFKEFIPLEKISKNSEFLVGIVLIGLGIWVFYRLYRGERKHSHIHVHNDDNPIIHEHDHSHESDGKGHDHTHPNLRQTIIGSLSIGFIHGLAGIAHFILLLPVLGFETKVDSVLYILGFAVGTLIAMIAFALVIGKVAAYSFKEHHTTFFKGIQLASGLFAVVIGVYWVLLNG